MAIRALDGGEGALVCAAHGEHAASGAQVGGVADVALDDEHALSLREANHK